MSHEQRFFNIAINETGCFHQGAEKIAEWRLAGYIGQSPIADCRDGFIAAGLNFLDLLDESISEEIEKSVEAGEDCEIAKELEILRAQSNLVSTEVFFKLLAKDWDERHEQE